MPNTILHRIAQGDEQAVVECTDHYGGLIWRLAKKHTKSLEDAEDAVQEIFVEIWQSAARFDSRKSSEMTFVLLIARRRLIDRLRKVYRQPKLHSIYDMAEVQPSIFEVEIHSRIEANKIIAAMSRIPLKQRELIVLTIFEGLSHNEIAGKTNLPLGTVKTRIRRGFQSVRKIMSRNSVRQDIAV